MPDTGHGLEEGDFPGIGIGGLLGSVLSGFTCGASYLGRMVV